MAGPSRAVVLCDRLGSVLLVVGAILVFSPLYLVGVFIGWEHRGPTIAEFGGFDHLVDEPLWLGARLAVVGLVLLALSFALAIQSGRLQRFVDEGAESA